MIFVLLFIIVISMPVFAKASELAVSLSYGVPFHAATTAVRSNAILFTDTDFNNIENVFGFSLLRMFNNSDSAGFYFSGGKFSMDLMVDDENYGKLNLMPMVVGIKFLTRPINSGWGMHLGLGMGTSINSFNKSQYTKNLEKDINNLDFDVKTSFVFDIEFGADYYFAKHLSLNTNLKWQGNSPYIKELYGLTDSYMNAHTFQLSCGLTYWFKLKDAK